MLVCLRLKSHKNFFHITRYNIEDGYLIKVQFFFFIEAMNIFQRKATLVIFLFQIYPIWVNPKNTRFKIVCFQTYWSWPLNVKLLKMINYWFFWKFTIVVRLRILFSREVHHPISHVYSILLIHRWFVNIIVLMLSRCGSVFRNILTSGGYKKISFTVWSLTATSSAKCNGYIKYFKKHKVFIFDLPISKLYDCLVWDSMWDGLNLVDPPSHRKRPLSHRVFSL